MGNQYVAIFQGIDPWGGRNSTADSIWDTPSNPVNTGLVNVDGTPIYRVPETVPMGFYPRVKKSSEK